MTAHDDVIRTNRLPRLIKLFMGRLFRVGRGGQAIFAFVGLVTLMILASIFSLEGKTPFEGDHRVVIVLGLIGFVVVIIASLIGKRFIELILQRRRGLAGSKLHVRLVTLFTLSAAVPTILVAIFSAILFNFGIENWFSSRVHTAVNESVAVAQSYLEEHKQSIKADALAMAQDLNRQAGKLLSNPNYFSEYMAAVSDVRSLTEAIVFDGNGNVLARSGLSFVLEFDAIPVSAIEKSRQGEVVILGNENDDRVRALVHLENYVDAFLYIGRFVDSNVLEHTKKTQEAAEDYEKLEVSRSGLQIKFVIIFMMVAAVLVLSAVWVALLLASQLSTPVRNLIDASEKISAGNLDIKVEEQNAGDELSILSRAFNKMTTQLASQRQDLVEANNQLDTRRRFTEAVLSGVSAGVLGLDEQGTIQFPNRRVLELLDIAQSKQIIGKPIIKILPEIYDLFEQAGKKPERIHETQIKREKDGEAKIFLVRIAVESVGKIIEGYVVTIDDISALMTAQRMAAWADVARRLAHEIKNPLTPIQLSAERLQRKYLPQIKEDTETFETCTETIVRQVGSLRQMVDEFSSFARMPAPNMRREKFAKICEQAIFLQQQAHKDLAYTFSATDADVEILCDGRQMDQVLTNLLLNAAEAIESKQEQDANIKGCIDVKLTKQDKLLTLTIADNGVGLPKQDRDRLTEPYVTTRSKGTGLGLAIVKKIIEDHKGRLILEDNPESSGALVIAEFETE